MSVKKVVILARGLGTRMKKTADDADLSDEQRQAAAEGMKAMMPIGRPFLDHCLSAYADAGLTEACLVIGPEHQAVRDYYNNLETERISVSFAVQEEPLGTANAVMAAEDWVGDDRFIMVNGDNYYPADVVALLRETTGNATVGFDAEAMVEQSNIPADRIAAFALLDRDRYGHLADIIEKPSPEILAEHSGRAMVSMNCFCFTPAVFEAGRRIKLSPRGEYEIVDAVREIIAMGEEFEVVPVKAGVLDMSSRGDVAAVEAVLKDRPVVL